MLDHYGVEYEDYDERGSIVVHGESLKFIESFPGIEQDQDTVLTFSRETALAREDMVFLTGDHPIVEATLSLLLDRGEGMATMCKWEDSPYDRGLILESSWILEALGPRSLELAKYLPVQMQEIQMDHRGKVLNEIRHRKDPSKLEALTWDDQQMTPKDMEKPLRALLAKIEKSMEGWVEKNRTSALSAAKKELDAELERIEYLARVNRSVTALDVANIKERNIRILDAIKKATPRLDAIRVIFTH
jgi:ATP-dependent helicase HepA